MKTIGTQFRESTTFKMVFTSWAVLLCKYLFAGLSAPFGAIPPMSATEFATAFAAITVIWLGREWRVTHYAKQT